MMKVDVNLRGVSVLESVAERNGLVVVVRCIVRYETLGLRTKLVVS